MSTDTGGSSDLDNDVIDDDVITSDDSDSESKVPDVVAEPASSLPPSSADDVGDVSLLCWNPVP